MPFLFFFLNFGGHESFLWVTDTPILDFWWHFLWVSKPEWVLPYLSLAEAYVLHYAFPEIHFWCDTCQPLGSQAISSTYLQGIGGTRNCELSCCCSQCEIRQARRSTDWAIPARLTIPFLATQYIFWKAWVNMRKENLLWCTFPNNFFVKVLMYPF